jgi:site-specific DNA-methyltransferase (adenine-specific)/adenine-specific DNA-methyltransferase
MLFSWDNKQNPLLDNPKHLNLIEKIESKSLIPPINKGLLVKGNNLEVMVSLLDEYKGKIDLIYIDPPYLTGLDFKTKGGTFAYTDKFTKDEYLQFVYERLYVMRELLKDTGSIYVHIDYRTSHYIRFILDVLFGEDNFRNEIIWHYRTYQGQVKSYYPRKHDTLFFYSKTNRNLFHLLKDNEIENCVDYKRWKHYLNDNNEITGSKYPKTDSRFQGYLNRFIETHKREPSTNRDVILKLEGQTIDSVWDIKAIDPKNSIEKIGYPTQKPEALLERIIKSSSNEGDLIADFFSGSGTTLAVAQKLNRNWLGVDLGDESIKTIKERMVNLDATFEIKVIE